MDTGNEGLGMPILDAFSTGLPVVGMNHTAISELLRDGRGILFDPGYRYRDVFGNVHRYYPGYETWSAAMTLAKNNPQLLKDTAIRAIEWFKGRTWENAAEILSEVI
jgi:glycosyltransferase involved in cell wall biosynthesis